MYKFFMMLKTFYISQVENSFILIRFEFSGFHIPIEFEFSDFYPLTLFLNQNPPESGAHPRRETAGQKSPGLLARPGENFRGRSDLSRQKQSQRIKNRNSKTGNFK